MTQLAHNISLKSYNSWRTGGLAQYFYQPKDCTDLINCLNMHRDKPITFWGLGSNILLSDQGIKGLVIHTQKGLNEIIVQDNEITAQAGVPLAKLAKVAAKAGLGDISFLATIPGTVGGALAMNAGCYGGETWDFVKTVVMINQKGELITFAPADFTIGYRQVLMPKGYWFVAATFALNSYPPDELNHKIKAHFKKRNQQQPTGKFSGGSVFRNPKPLYAGKLIEACGLKGARLHDALISPEHANFIINEGQAQSSDIYYLMQQAMQQVEQKFGIDLRPEVQLLGDWQSLNSDRSKA